MQGMAVVVLGEPNEPCFLGKHTCLQSGLDSAAARWRGPKVNPEGEHGQEEEMPQRGRGPGGACTGRGAFLACLGKRRSLTGPTAPTQPRLPPAPACTHVALGTLRLLPGRALHACWAPPCLLCPCSCAAPCSPLPAHTHLLHAAAPGHARLVSSVRVHAPLWLMHVPAASACPAGRVPPRSSHVSSSSSHTPTLLARPVDRAGRRSLPHLAAHACPCSLHVLQLTRARAARACPAAHPSVQLAHVPPTSPAAALPACSQLRAEVDSAGAAGRDCSIGIKPGLAGHPGACGPHGWAVGTGREGSVPAAVVRHVCRGAPRVPWCATCAMVRRDGCRCLGLVRDVQPWENK